VRAVADFFRWCERMGLDRLDAVEPVHVAAYVEQLGTLRSAPTVKQHLAAVRMLFDWLVVGQVVPSNPASVVRGPSHVVKRFARVSAALGMRVEDYFPQGKRWWLRLHEKGGKRHEMPVHHTLEEYLDSYIAAAGLLKEPKSPLFRASNGKTKVLSDRPFERRDALKMVHRRAKAAGIRTKIGNHTFRATGITIYLTNGGDLEKAQQMAAHESPRTTKLYDRRNDVVSLDEVEKVVF
jgi:site-specific recombinase XerD